LADVTPLSGNLEIAGSYRNVLAFARTLESNERLLNMTNVSWLRPDNGFEVHLSALVTRYVMKTPPAAAAAPGAPAASANNNS
jgi:Tfp pilus assembly protein PilO